MLVVDCSCSRGCSKVCFEGFGGSESLERAELVETRGLGGARCLGRTAAVDGTHGLWEGRKKEEEGVELS